MRDGGKETKEMCQKNKKRIRLFFTINIIALFIFLLLLGTGKVKYGERVVVVDANDYYMNTASRSVSASNVYKQTFEYDGEALYSFKLKYGITHESQDMTWTIQLFNEDGLVQKWEEQYENISQGILKEYIVDSQYKCTAGKYTVAISTDYEDESGVCIYGSDFDSCLSGSLYINDVEQEGDTTIIVSESTNVRITLFYAIALSVLLALAIVWIVHKKICYRIWDMLRKALRDYTIRRQIFACICVYSFSFIAFIAIRRMVLSGSFPLEQFHEYFYALFFAIFANGMVMLILRKHISERPEIVFSLMLFVIGVLYIYALPADAEISWDEAIHFWRTIGVANATTGMANEAESLLYWKSGIPFSLPNTIGNLNSAYQTVENVYRQNIMTGANTDILSSLYGIAYVPAAIFINLGKTLNLHLWQVFKVGILGFLITYVVNIYFAMKKVVSGKMIIATVSSIGTAFFLATVYSTDSWIIGFSILGFAYFVGIMQREGTITNREWITMVTVLTLSYFPKTVYFPLMLILLFLPKGKFAEEKQYRNYISAVLASATFLAIGILTYSALIVVLWLPLYWFYKVFVNLFLNMNNKKKIVFCIVCGCAFIVLAYFMICVVLPMVVGEGDARGGETVNAVAQLTGIINNPMSYVNVLKTFLFGHYLSYQNNLKNLFDYYGYLGTSGFYYVGTFLVCVACLTDKNKRDCYKRVGWIRVTTLGLVFLTIVLIASALYISFTPVGFYTVLGCQQRYLLPLIYPVLAVLGTGKFVNPIKKFYYNSILIIGVNGYLLVNILKLAIVRYTI